jgi:hypothetical protein
MKVINLLEGAEVEIDSILAMYTGPLQGLSNDTPQEPEIFEMSVSERIMPQDLVLHELNLLQVGFIFWIKIDAAPGGGVVWVPARMDP